MLCEKPLLVEDHKKCFFFCGAKSENILGGSENLFPILEAKKEPDFIFLDFPLYPQSNAPDFSNLLANDLKTDSAPLE